MSGAVEDYNYVINEQRLVGTYIGEMSDAVGITIHPSLGEIGSSLLTETAYREWNEKREIVIQYSLDDETIDGFISTPIGSEKRVLHVVKPLGSEHLGQCWSLYSMWMIENHTEGEITAYLDTLR